LLPLVCLELQALLAELEPLLGVWEQVSGWEGEEEGEVWQRRGRAVFWESLEKQEEEGEVWQRRGRAVFWESLEKQEEGMDGRWEAGEVGVGLWEEEAVSLLWEAEEEVFWMEEEGEVFSWLGEEVVFLLWEEGVAASCSQVLVQVSC